MGNHIRTTLRLVNFFLIITIIFSIFSVGFNLYLIFDERAEDEFENFSSDNWPDSNSGLLVSICFIIIIVFAFAAAWFGILIAFGILMILSRKQDPNLRSDGLIGGVLVLCAIGSGIFAQIPYFNSLSPLLGNGLIFGGIMIFLRKLLPDRSKKTNKIAFGLIITGGVFSFLSQLIDQIVDIGSESQFLLIIGTFFTVSGVVMFLSLLNKVEYVGKE